MALTGSSIGTMLPCPSKNLLRMVHNVFLHCCSIRVQIKLHFMHYDRRKVEDTRFSVFFYGLWIFLVGVASTRWPIIGTVNFCHGTLHLKRWIEVISKGAIQALPCKHKNSRNWPQRRTLVYGSICEDTFDVWRPRVRCVKKTEQKHPVDVSVVDHTGF